MIIFDGMDLRADIQWIQKELEEIQDPKLIDMLKRLIQYGKSQKEMGRESLIPEWYDKEIQKRRQLHLDGEGTSYTVEEFKQQVLNEIDQ